MTQDELAVILEGVDGWLGIEEAYHLYTLASQVTEGVITEIGAYHGRSTLALAWGARIGSRYYDLRVESPAIQHSFKYVYSIDPHHDHTQGGVHFIDEDGLAWARNVLEKCKESHVKPVFLPSEIVGKCWQYPIGLLFIDGMHDNVESDWNDFSPHVTTDGRVAVHDSTGAWDAPTALVKRVVEDGAWVMETQIGYTSVLKRGNE